MIHPSYLRRQAAICLRLSAAVRDRKTAEALVVMADVSDRADEVDPSLDDQAGVENSRSGRMGRQARRRICPPIQRRCTPFRLSR